MSSRYWCLSDFDISSPIGSGRFGKVYLAREKRSKYICAIKVVRKKTIIKKKLENQLFYEIKSYKNLIHDNILRFHGYFFDDDCVYMVLQYAPRGNLGDYIEKFRKLDEKFVVRFFFQIVEGVNYIHNNGIIHRDLKPSNIMISISETPLIGDFGLAASCNTTKFESVVGTLDYLSPEVVSSLCYGTHSDIWSLGVILYEMLLGNTPFSGKTNSEIHESLTKANIILPDSISSISRDLLARLLEKDYQKRISMKQLLFHPYRYSHEI